MRPNVITHQYDAPSKPLRVKELVELLNENFGQEDFILDLNLSTALQIKVRRNDL